MHPAGMGRQSPLVTAPDAVASYAEGAVSGEDALQAGRIFGERGSRWGTESP